MLLGAWRGQEAAALEKIEAGIQDATARGLDRPIGFAQWVTAVLYNGLGRYQDALAAAQRACAHEDLGFFGFALSELVEAAARTDSRDVASDALRQLEEAAAEIKSVAGGSTGTIVIAIPLFVIFKSAGLLPSAPKLFSHTTARPRLSPDRSVTSGP